MDQKLQGQIRAALAAIAGIAVTLGWVDAETAGWIVGVGLYAIVSLWSWKSKKKTP